MSPVTSGGSGDLLDLVVEKIGPGQEARWIVEHARRSVGATTSSLAVESDAPAQTQTRTRTATPAVTGSDDGDPPTVRSLALSLAERRAGGEPLQYVLGTWPFRSIELLVDRRVLIPRPETEQVVEVALQHLRRLAADRPTTGPSSSEGRRGPLHCVDLGTGSGAIALSLAVEGPANPGCLVWATDASPAALDVATANREALAGKARDVRFGLGSWFSPLPATLQGKIDLVVSNPPYVAAADMPGLDPEVTQWEPHEALVAPTGASGVPGTADIETVIRESARWLRPLGVLVVELDPRQAYAAVDVARRCRYATVGTARDLVGRMRMVVAVR